MKLREHFKIFRRGVRFAFSENKRYALMMTMHSFLSSVIIYIPIYFSAKVIDALTANDPIETIILYAALTVGIVFLLDLLKTYISSEKDVAMNSVWRNREWLYSEKAMQMAYESIEDPDVTRLRYRIQTESQTGYNLYFLYQHIERLAWQITKIIASVALTVSFFTVTSVPVGFKLLITAGLILTLMMQIFTTKKTNKIDRDFNEFSVDMNVLGEHFYDYILDYGAGKDIRLYDMGKFLGDSYLGIEKEYYERYLKISYKKAAWTLPVNILGTVLKFGIYAVLVYAALQGGITVG